MIGVHVGGRWSPGSSVVYGSELGTVLSSEMFVLHLIGGWLEMLLVASSQLCFRGTRLDAHAAVEADVLVVDDGVLRDDGAVLVDVGHMDAAEVRDSVVVGKCSTAPLAADETDAAVAEAVVNSAVEADVRAPIASVPAINAASEAPIARSPKNANPGRLHPNTRNPIVARVSVGPIAGGPEIARSGERRLHVHGKSGWSNAHGDTDTDGDLRVRDRQGEHRRSNRGGKKQPTKSRENRHNLPPEIDVQSILPFFFRAAGT